MADELQNCILIIVLSHHIGVEGATPKHLRYKLGMETVGYKIVSGSDAYVVPTHDH